MLYIGCHLSYSKGYEAMGRQALDIDANTFLLTIKYSLLDKDERNKYIQQVRRIEQKLSDEDNGILIIHKLKK